MNTPERKKPCLISFPFSQNYFSSDKLVKVGGQFVCGVFPSAVMPGLGLGSLECSGCVHPMHGKEKGHCL